MISDAPEPHGWVFERGGGTPVFRSGTRRRYRPREVRVSRNAVQIIYERATPA